MPPLNRNRRLVTLRSVGRAGLVWLLFVAAQGQSAMAGATSQELTDRSRQIESMTSIERDRLQRNWDLFRSLPEDQKRHYRELHQQIQADRNSGGRLHDTLETYSVWLQTLTPGQRADLREATDPTRKLELVRKLKKEQDQNQSHALEDPAWDMSSWRGRFPRFGMIILDSAGLKAALQALAKELPPDEREDLAAADSLKDKWNAYKRVIEAGARQAGGRGAWPNPAQQKVIEAAVKSLPDMERYARIPDDERRRQQFGRLLLNSLSAELMSDGEAFLPKKSELPALFEQMPNAEREQIMRDLPRHMIPQLLRKYHESKRNDPAYQEFDQIRRNTHGFIIGFWRDADLGGPVRFGGGPGRPGDRAGDPDRRGPRDRNPPGNGQ